MHLRVERFRQRLHELRLDGFLISSLPFIRYLFGFSGSSAIALVTSSTSHFITDRRYVQQSAEQVTNAEIIVAKEDLFAELSQIESLSRLKVVGIETQHLPVRDYFMLKKHLQDIKLMGTERVCERIMSIKEPEEVESIRKAGALCVAALEAVLTIIEPGVRELDVAAEISYQVKRLGSERDPFEPIVASGRRAALPHGIATEKKIEYGDLVIVDFGATIDGYASDFTRTLVIGKPSADQSKLAALVEGALSRSAEAAFPGITGKELDGVARAFISANGHGNHFQHSLGHGLGLSVHGLPRIGERSPDKIAAGNVITLEPGIYIPEFGGIRIEDDFVIAENGAENLTPMPRGLMSV